MASPAWLGLSGSPPGEKTVALVGLTVLPAAAESLLEVELDEGALSPSSSLSRPPTSPKILLRIDARPAAPPQ